MSNIRKLEALEILKEKKDRASEEKYASLTDNCQAYKFGREEAFEEAIEVLRRVSETLSNN